MTGPRMEPPRRRKRIADADVAAVVQEMGLDPNDDDVLAVVGEEFPGSVIEEDERPVTRPGPEGILEAMGGPRRTSRPVDVFTGQPIDRTRGATPRERAEQQFERTRPQLRQPITPEGRTAPAVTITAPRETDARRARQARAQLFEQDVRGETEAGVERVAAGRPLDTRREAEAIAGRTDPEALRRAAAQLRRQAAELAATGDAYNARRAQRLSTQADNLDQTARDSEQAEGFLGIAARDFTFGSAFTDENRRLFEARTQPDLLPTLEEQRAAGVPDAERVLSSEPTGMMPLAASLAGQIIPTAVGIGVGRRVAGGIAGRLMASGRPGLAGAAEALASEMATNRAASLGERTATRFTRGALEGNLTGAAIGIGGRVQRGEEIGVGDVALEVGLGGAAGGVLESVGGAALDAVRIARRSGNAAVRSAADAVVQRVEQAFPQVGEVAQAVAQSLTRERTLPSAAALWDGLREREVKAEVEELRRRVLEALERVALDRAAEPTSAQELEAIAAALTPESGLVVPQGGVAGFPEPDVPLRTQREIVTGTTPIDEANLTARTLRQQEEEARLAAAAEEEARYRAAGLVPPAESTALNAINRAVQNPQAYLAAMAPLAITQDGEETTEEESAWRLGLATALALVGGGALVNRYYRQLRIESPDGVRAEMYGRFREQGYRGVPQAADLRDEFMATRPDTVNFRRAGRIDTQFAQTLANWYDQTPSNPTDPETVEAYRLFAKETKAQYDFLVSRGLLHEANLRDPYPNSAAMMRDVWDNGRLRTFKSDGPAHALLDEATNDMFRAVHDYFGHASQGNEFGAVGEENAYRSHAAMYSPLARRAMATETRGQNSWVNFGPKGPQNRADPANTIYAEQKAILMPQEWADFGLEPDLNFRGVTNVELQGGKRGGVRGETLRELNDPRATPVAAARRWVRRSALRRFEGEVIAPIARAMRLPVEVSDGLGLWLSDSADVSLADAARIFSRAGIDPRRFAEFMARVSEAAKQDAAFFAFRDPNGKRVALELDAGRALTEREAADVVSFLGKQRYVKEDGTPAFTGLTVTRLSPTRMMVVLEKGTSIDLAGRMQAAVEGRFGDMGFVGRTYRATAVLDLADAGDYLRRMRKNWRRPGPTWQAIEQATVEAGRTYDAIATSVENRARILRGLERAGAALAAPARATAAAGVALALTPDEAEAQGAGGETMALARSILQAGVAGAVAASAGGARGIRRELSTALRNVVGALRTATGEAVTMLREQQRTLSQAMDRLTRESEMRLPPLSRRLAMANGTGMLLDAATANYRARARIFSRLRESIRTSDFGATEPKSVEAWISRLSKSNEFDQAEFREFLLPALEKERASSDGPPGWLQAVEYAEERAWLRALDQNGARAIAEHPETLDADAVEGYRERSRADAERKLNALRAMLPIDKADALVRKAEQFVRARDSLNDESLSPQARRAAEQAVAKLGTQGEPRLTREQVLDLLPDNYRPNVISLRGIADERDQSGGDLDLDKLSNDVDRALRGRSRGVRSDAAGLHGRYDHAGKRSRLMQLDRALDALDQTDDVAELRAAIERATDALDQLDVLGSPNVTPEALRDADLPTAASDYDDASDDVVSLFNAINATADWQTDSTQLAQAVSDVVFRAAWNDAITRLHDEATVVGDAYENYRNGSVTEAAEALDIDPSDYYSRPEEIDIDQYADTQTIAGAVGEDAEDYEVRFATLGGGEVLRAGAFTSKNLAHFGSLDIDNMVAHLRSASYEVVSPDDVPESVRGDLMAALDKAGRAAESLAAYEEALRKAGVIGFDANGQPTWLRGMDGSQRVTAEQLQQDYQRAIDELANVASEVGIALDNSNVAGVPSRIIEEVQSDYGQRGRVTGFRRVLSPVERAKRIADATKAREQRDAEWRAARASAQEARQQAERAWEEIGTRLGVPVEVGDIGDTDGAPKVWAFARTKLASEIAERVLPQYLDIVVAGDSTHPAWPVLERMTNRALEAYGGSSEAFRQRALNWMADELESPDRARRLLNAAQGFYTDLTGAVVAYAQRALLRSISHYDVPQSVRNPMPRAALDRIEQTRASAEALRLRTSDNEFGTPETIHAMRELLPAIADMLTMVREATVRASLANAPDSGKAKRVAIAHVVAQVPQYRSLMLQLARTFDRDSRVVVGSPSLTDFLQSDDPAEVAEVATVLASLRDDGAFDQFWDNATAEIVYGSDAGNDLQSLSRDMGLLEVNMMPFVALVERLGGVAEAREIVRRHAPAFDRSRDRELTARRLEEEADAARDTLREMRDSDVINGSSLPASPWESSAPATAAAVAGELRAVVNGSNIHESSWLGWQSAETARALHSLRIPASRQVYGPDGAIAGAIRAMHEFFGLAMPKVETRIARGYPVLGVEISPEFKKRARAVGLPFLGAMATLTLGATEAEAQDGADRSGGNAWMIGASAFAAGVVLGRWSAIMRAVKNGQPLSDADKEIARLLQENRSLGRAIERDDLTGLASAAAYRKAVAGADADPNLSWLLLDGQKFKAVNDTLGHTEGDRALAHFGTAIATVLDGMDLPLRAFRRGGDEFAVIVPSGRAAEIAQAIEAASAITMGSGDKAVTTRLNVGIGNTADEADAALNTFKQAAQAADPSLRRDAPVAPDDAASPPAGGALGAAARGGAVAGAVAAYDEFTGESMGDAGLSGLAMATAAPLLRVRRNLPALEALLARLRAQGIDPRTPDGFAQFRAEYDAITAATTTGRAPSPRDAERAAYAALGFVEGVEAGASPDDLALAQQFSQDVRRGPAAEARRMARQRNPMLGDAGEGLLLGVNPVGPALAALRAAPSAAGVAAVGYLLSHSDDPMLNRASLPIMALGALNAVGLRRMGKARDQVMSRLVQYAKTNPATRQVMQFLNPDALLDPTTRAALLAFEGTVATGKEKALRFGRASEKLGPAVDRLVSDLREGEMWEDRAQFSAADIQAATTLAAQIGAEIDELSLAMNQEGLLSDEALARYIGNHMTRLYAEFEVLPIYGTRERPGAGGGRNPSVGRLRSRTIDAAVRDAQGALDEARALGDPQDIADAENALLAAEADALGRRTALGEIREASVRVARQMATQHVLVGAARLFRALRDNPEAMHPDYPKAIDDLLAAKQLAAQNPGDPQARQMVVEATRALALLRRRFETESEEGWVTLPDSPTFGAMAGAVVRPEVYASLRPMMEGPTAMERLLRFWKRSKTVWNPGTHLANVVSNTTMAHVAGMSLIEQPYWLGRAMADYKTNGPITQRLRQAGILGVNAVEDESAVALGPTRETLRRLARTTTPETRDVLVERSAGDVLGGSRLLEAGQRIAGGAATAYAAEDDIFRVALAMKAEAPRTGFISARPSGMGMTPDEATEFARSALGNFRTRSPALRLVRNTLSPFLLYPMKALPAFAGHVIEHPWRYLTLVTMWGALDQYAQAEQGEIEERDIEFRDRRRLGYFFPGLTALPMEPGDRGERFAVDISRFTPLSGATTAAPPGTSLGAALIEGFPQQLQPSGPAMDAVSIVRNRDPFTQQPIVSEAMPPAMKARAAAEQAARLVLPPWLGYHIPRVIEDRRNNDPDAARVDALGMMGLRPRSLPPGEAARRARFEMEQEVRRAEETTRRRLRRSARADSARREDIRQEGRDWRSRAREQFRERFSRPEVNNDIP